ncbi:MAG: hypothetical protein KTR32_13565, partial [Granulosicoccus sp.]|nr:hypothetical protein [Granulosicoccus sp.]
SSAQDAQLQPLQAHTVSLENYTAVVYYTVLDNGDFQIVATVGPNAGFDGAMSQHMTTMKPGQSYNWTLDTGIAGQPATAMTFTADFNKLIIASN